MNKLGWMPWVWNMNRFSLTSGTTSNCLAFFDFLNFCSPFGPFGKATAPDANISSSERNMSVAPLSRNSNKLRRSWYSNSSWLIQNFSLGDFTSFANLARSGRRMDSQATKQIQSNLEKGTDRYWQLQHKYRQNQPSEFGTRQNSMMPNVTRIIPYDTPGKLSGTFGPFTICALVGTANVNVLVTVVYQTWCVCIWGMLLSCCFSLWNASLRKSPDPIQIVLDAIPGAHANHPEDSQEIPRRNSWAIYRTLFV